MYAYEEVSTLCTGCKRLCIHIHTILYEYVYVCTYTPMRVCISNRVMRAAVPIPAVAAASVSHSAADGGSVVGVVGLL